MLQNGIHLPPFCNWTPEEWKEKGQEYDEIRDVMLGWDITDYGLGDFEKTGFALIIHVYNDRDGELGTSDVRISSDGYSCFVPAGTGVELHPGESLTLLPHQYHDFDVVPGTGDVLIGEVSMCNEYPRVTETSSLKEEFFKGDN